MKMIRKRNGKRRNQNTNFPARENHPRKNTQNRFGAQIPDGAVESGNRSSSAVTLNPICPDPESGFQPLTNYLRKELSKSTLRYLQSLCDKRGIKLDYKYWQTQVERILGAPDPKTAMIIPSRAGAGKSTVILAMLLALTKKFLSEHDVANNLVGAVLVVQKVETLNDIEATIRNYFPDSPENTIVALQGWSRSGQKYEFCPNKGVNSFEDCVPEECPVAAGCKILEFKSKSPEAFLLGITQARFSLLRESGELDKILFRDVAGKKLPRRFIIFDEKFEMAETAILGTDIINEASNEIERRGRNRKFLTVL